MEPRRCGMGAISDNVRLVEQFDLNGGSSLLVALCSVKRCEHLANGFRDANVPVCFDHGAAAPSCAT
jgi:hypothetical protein